MRRWVLLKIWERVIILFLFVVTLLLASVFSFKIQSNHSKLFDSNSHNLATKIADDFQASIEGDIKVLISIREAWVREENRTRSSFSRIAAPYLSFSEAVQAIEWIPKVTRRLESEFVLQAQRDGFPDFNFIDRDKSGEHDRAPNLFPVYYVVPYVGNERDLGLDLFSEPIRRNTIKESCSTGKMVASKVLDLQQGIPGILIFEPVIEGEARFDSSCTDISGFILGVYQFQELVEDKIALLLPREVSLELLEKETALFSSSLPLTKTTRTIEKAIQLPNRIWTLRFSFSPNFLPRETGAFFWPVGLTSFSVLFIVFLSFIMTERRKILHIVKKRTLELEDSHTRILAGRTRAQKSEKLASIGVLSAGIAHEINNPLAIVSGATDILINLSQSGKLSEASLNENLKKQKDAIKRIMGIIKSLRTYARDRPGESESLQVSELVENSAELVKSTFKAKGIQIELYLSPEALILGNSGRFQQVIMNLLTNALDALEVKGRGLITIETKVNESLVNVIIRDDGDGIAPENLPQIFDMFYTSKPIGKGTGMGLSFCDSIVKEMGGKIRVESTVGVGTTFILSFPKIEPSEKLKVSPIVSPAPRSPARNTKRILVVDDEPDIRGIICSLLEEGGYEVEEASGGFEALQKFKLNPPSVIVTDNRMPDLSGIDLIKQISQESDQIQFVLITGDFDNIERGILEKVAVVSKPFTQEDILQAIEESLKIRKEVA